jgi:hypothetical protein
MNDAEKKQLADEMRRLAQRQETRQWNKLVLVPNPGVIKDTQENLMAFGYAPEKYVLLERRSGFFLSPTSLFRTTPSRTIVADIVRPELFSLMPESDHEETAAKTTEEG